jgi:hypothetical protein
MHFALIVTQQISAVINLRYAMARVDTRNILPKHIGLKQSVHIHRTKLQQLHCSKVRYIPNVLAQTVM